MRRRRPERRQIHPDPVYKDLLVAKFVNNLMMDGKKSIAEKIFYGAIKNIESQTKSKDGLSIFKKASSKGKLQLSSNTHFNSFKMEKGIYLFII